VDLDEFNAHRKHGSTERVEIAGPGDRPTALIA
jgi:hypothetical protein